MATTAKGTFEVKLRPQASDPATHDESLGRMSIEKQFQGDIEGTSRGEMLTAGTAVNGSGAYVAIEKVTATLHGQSGTFILYHQGIMTRGTPRLAITVVPDSGTGELGGIAGTLDIEIVEGKHYYSLDYTLTS